MKQFILILFICIANSTFAQYESWSKAEVYLTDGTVKTGEAKFPLGGSEGPFTAKERLRFRIADRKPVKLIDARKIEKVVLKLSYTKRKKGRRVKINREATFVTYSVNKKKTKKAFAELVINGKIKLLKKAIIFNTNNRFSTITVSLLVKNDELPLIFNNGKYKSFKKRVAEYFQDCPNLVSKIKDKIFTKEDLETVVSFYNDNCAK